MHLSASVQSPESRVTNAKLRVDDDERQTLSGPSRLRSVVVVGDSGRITGGQAKVAIESALQLKQRGLDVCFFAGKGPVDARLIEAGVDCRSVGEHDILTQPNRLRAVRDGIWNFESARQLSDCISSRDPGSTVVHLHGWAKVLSPSIGPVVTRSKAAHVYTLHEYFLGCPNGGFYDYQAGAICTRRALGVDCLRTNCDSRSVGHKAWRVARQGVLRGVSRMPQEVREVIYLAPEQISILAPYLSPEARWHHLPNPVEPAPRQRIEAERHDFFLFIGRFSREKGATVVAEAAKIAGVPIVFAGDGECRDDILRANPSAKVLGWLGSEELSVWMSQARCLVFPSLWYECYPLVVSDALRIGLPVIISKATVAAATIADEVSGLHVTPGDPGAWADAMTRLKSDDLVRRLATAAFAAGQQLLHEDDYAVKLLQIYERVLARKSARADQRT